MCLLIFTARLRALVCAGAIVLAGLPLGASAATFTGEFWSASRPSNNINQALRIINENTPTATFTSSVIDYPNGGQQTIGSTGTLAAFLGADAASIVGDALASIENSVFRFSGFLDMLPGNQLFNIASDDGFRLTINGRRVAQQNRPRSFDVTEVSRNPGEGRLAFDLLFYENAGNTGIEFRIDNQLATPAPVPVPAGFGLLAAALAGLGIAAQRKRRQIALASNPISLHR